MKIDIVGGGPGGLFLGYLVKKYHPTFRVRVFEQNPKDATFGFGVVLAAGGLEQMKRVDEAAFARITEGLHWVAAQRFTHRGDSVWLDKKSPGASVERLRLLQTLQVLCGEVGVETDFRTPVTDLALVSQADLLVGSDGANSLVRRQLEPEFGTQTRLLTNRFAWYGVAKAFDSGNLNFKEIPGGVLVGHYYPYAEGLSTFVMECDAQTWLATGMDRMTDDERRRFTQAFFLDELDGEELLANNSIWRQFAVVSNQRWFVGNTVLIGDAQRPAHYSIGSGTRLALEDAIALFESIQRHGDNVPQVLEDFSATRGPQKQKLISASENSFNWYEQMRSVMATSDVVGLAHSFLSRTGRISKERMEAEFPRFMERFHATRNDVSHAATKGSP